MRPCLDVSGFGLKAQARDLKIHDAGATHMDDTRFSTWSVHVEIQKFDY